uniref:Fatty acid hydroxylase domain-containing protein n=1 Tax=Compsopogon caeruleus TaxID=31354 RepID=A0A7S1XA58_9RHOD
MLVELTTLCLVLSFGYIEKTWIWLCENTSEYLMTVCGMFVSLVVGYLAGCVPYVVLDRLRLPFLDRYKVQKGRYANKADYVMVTMKIMGLFFIIMLPMIAMSTPIFRWLGMTRDPPLPDWTTVAIQIIFFFIVEDYMNYWIHRWLHTPWAYKAIHSVHHEYSAPFSVAATYAHPLEVILLGIPTFTGPALVGPHLFTLWIWLLMRQYEAIDIHSGYEFPWNINRYFPFYAGTAQHDLHHFRYSGNFASVFTWCDQLYGTKVR